jgi:hypothetical protein
VIHWEGLLRGKDVFAKKTVTFRDQITGCLSDLMSDEGIACAHSQKILSYFSGALVNYREEGVELTPTILFCRDISGVLEGVPGAVHYEIGTMRLSSEGGSRILKDCGVLAGGNWFIYVERQDDEELNYGVAAYPILPTAVSLQEAIGISVSNEALLIRKISPNTVGVYGARGSELTLLFSTVRDIPVVSADDQVYKFANSSSVDLSNEDEFSSFRRYFRDLLGRSLSASHGSILVCVEGSEVPVMDDIRDVVALKPTLDFFSVFDEYRRMASAEAIVRLQSYEELLIGFLKSDGIVMFTSRGCVVAYRAFYRPTSISVDSDSGGETTAAKVVGGARRRAFEGISSLVGGGSVKSALFRSQDGLTLFKGVEL